MLPDVACRWYECSYSSYRFGLSWLLHLVDPGAQVFNGLVLGLDGFVELFGVVAEVLEFQTRTY